MVVRACMGCLISLSVRSVRASFGVDRRRRSAPSAFLSAIGMPRPMASNRRGCATAPRRSPNCRTHCRYPPRRSRVAGSCTAAQQAGGHRLLYVAAAGRDVSCARISKRRACGRRVLDKVPRVRGETHRFEERPASRARQVSLYTAAAGAEWSARHAAERRSRLSCRRVPSTAASRATTPTCTWALGEIHRTLRRRRACRRRRPASR